MRFAHLRRPESDIPVLAVIDGDGATLVSDLVDPAPATLQQLIEGGDDLLARVREAHADGEAPVHPLDGFAFSAVPPKLRGVGTFPVRAMAKLARGRR